MKKKIYLTIVAMNFDSDEELSFDGDFNADMSIFEIGDIVKLEKEHREPDDLDGVGAKSLFNGKIGYVANNNYRKVRGTLSAEILFEIVKDDVAYAKIKFITDKEIIVELLDSKKSKNEIEVVALLFKKGSEDKGKLKVSEESEELNIEEDFLEDSISLTQELGNMGVEFSKADLIANEDKIKSFLKNKFGDTDIEFSDDNLTEDEDKIKSLLKNKLTTITIEKYLKSKGLKPIDFEIFSKGADTDSFEVHVISQLKEELELDSKPPIDHEEIAILAYKEEKLIDKYFEIKEKVLDIDSNIKFEIKKDKLEFHTGIHFLTISIEKDHVLTSIKTSKQLDLDDKLEVHDENTDNEDKSENTYNVVIKADENIDNLIELVKEVLK
ncbi:MAG: DUF5655 domain-containing protein [Methanobrevibacter sp.]|jgi:hypothetical protein|nr:DUF5655 domain-containing protein [Methanobrevibacter sp.]